MNKMTYLAFPNMFFISNFNKYNTARVFNTHDSNVRQDTSENIPVSQSKFMKSMPDTTPDSMTPENI
jgi:pyrroloquinoline quinone (PQQ) biosynthesis protein C